MVVQLRSGARDGHVRVDGWSMPATGVSHQSGDWCETDRAGAARRRVSVASAEERGQATFVGEHAPQVMAMLAWMAGRCQRREFHTSLLGRLMDGRNMILR